MSKRHAVRGGLALGLAGLAALTLGAAPGRAQDEQEALVNKINQVALTQEELPAGWTLLEDRVQDPIYFREFSAIKSMFDTLPETGSLNLGYAIQTPDGAFNVEYFAFPKASGANIAEGHMKLTAQKNNWLALRFGDVLMLVATTNRQAQEFITQKKLIPFLEQLLAESIQAEQQGNVAAAEQGYYAVVQAAPIYAKAWLRLGTIYQRSNPPRQDAAMEAYQKAVEANAKAASLTDEELWQAKVGLARTTGASGNMDGAIKILEEARLLGGKLGPEQEAKSDYFLAVVYAAKNDDDKFLDYLEAALDIQKSEGKSDLVQMAGTEPAFEGYKDKKKFKKLLKKYGKD
jgi:tetratricopeptide (TPR) repeat protein